MSPANQRETDDPGRAGGGGGIIWPWVLLLIAVAVFMWPRRDQDRPEIAYSLFKSQLQDGNIARLEAEGDLLRGQFRQAVELPSPDQDQRQAQMQFQTRLPPFGDPELTAEIIAQDVEFISSGRDNFTMWLVLLNVLPLMLLLGLGVMMVRGASRQNGGLMNVGRSQAKRFVKQHTSTTFEDVAGAAETKQGLKEIISFLKNPQPFLKLGCRVPKGVLLVGPPGTGKTLLARAVAGEADVPFFSITGSDFMEMFVGVGASRVRDLFRKAKQNAPCIIFLDELDSVGRHRGAGVGGGHDEREQTLNQLLSEIDGFEPNDNLVVIAATNRPDILDPALLRPGRFDRQFVVDLPTLSERLQILMVHTRAVPLGEDVNLEEIARSMPGHSGADLGNLVNEAALLAARKHKNMVNQAEFHDARDRLLMGQLRGSVVLSGREKQAVAVHEAGHAISAHLAPDADPVEKVSIIPRGRALGITQQLPEERFTMTAEYLHSRLIVLLGGRASEEVLLGSISTGAADDLAQATRLARRMVAQWGMSDKFRHLAFRDDDQEVFLGEQLGHGRAYSDQTAREIDLEVKEMVDNCYDQAHRLLSRYRQRLQTMARVLEEEESLEGERLRQLLDGEISDSDQEMKAS